MARERRGEEEE
jgi:hypothetical protein